MISLNQRNLNPLGITTSCLDTCPSFKPDVVQQYQGFYQFMFLVPVYYVPEKVPTPPGVSTNNLCLQKISGCQDLLPYLSKLNSTVLPKMQ